LTVAIRPSAIARRQFCMGILDGQRAFAENERHGAFADI
jgi:hypothetical protein